MYPAIYFISYKNHSRLFSPIQNGPISFFFLINDTYSNSFYCCSSFQKGFRDYTENQAKLAILKKEVKSFTDSDWTTLYRSSHLEKHGTNDS